MSLAHLGPRTASFLQEITILIADSVTQPTLIIHIPFHLKRQRCQAHEGLRNRKKGIAILEPQ